MQRALSSEFPNDNDELHVGTIWMSEEPCGQPAAHFSPRLEETPSSADDELIEIVECLAIEEPEEIVPAPILLDMPMPELVALAPVEPVPDVEEPLCEPIESARDTEILPPPPETTPGLEATVAAPFEIELTLDEEPEADRIPAPIASDIVVSSECAEAIALAIDLTPAPLPADLFAAIADEPSVPSPAADPFVGFLDTMTDAAAAVGAALDRRSLEACFESDPVAIAWRAILRGESEDFSLCATTLDEWASELLATLLGSPSRAAHLRRELRTRGVAAFGLVDAA